MNNKIKIIFIIVVALLIILSIYLAVTRVFKQYKENCGKGWTMGENNECRQICDTDKDPNCEKGSGEGGTCTHPIPGGTGCESCPPGLSWTGEQCKHNCHNHGTYDSVEKGCDCKGSPSENYPAINPDPSKIPPNGWTGLNCETSLNKCLGTDKKPGAPDNLKAIPVWDSSGKYTAQDGDEPLVCSGNGMIINNAGILGLRMQMRWKMERSYM